MGQGRQGHQLQVQPIAPALPQLQQCLPTGLASGAATVDVAADRPQAMAPGPLQGPLTPLPHLLGAALGRLPPVGLHGAGHGALPIREGRGGKGLVEVGVGLHRRGDRQGQARTPGRRRIQGQDAGDATLLPGQLHRHQAVGIRRRQPGVTGVEQTARQPRRQPARGGRGCRADGTHRLGPWPLCTRANCPAAAKVTAS